MNFHVRAHKKHMRIFVKLLIAVTPLTLTFLFAWYLVEIGGFGGGEKDIFLALPPLVWSLTFLVSFIVLWWRKSTLGRSAGISAAVATGLVIVVSVLLFFGVS